MFIPHVAQCLHPLYSLVKKGACVSLEIRAQATFEKTKILVKQMEVLDISRAGLPFE